MHGLYFECGRASADWRLPPEPFRDVMRAAGCSAGGSKLRPPSIVTLLSSQFSGIGMSMSRMSI